jgi:thiol-disulfide isomerase/thioredoxin
MKIGVYLFMGYTVFSYARLSYKRGYAIPRMRSEWTSLFSDLLFLVLSVFLLNMIRNNYETPMEAVMRYKGKTLPEFSYTSMSTGMERTLKERQEKVIILNIWATWCPPCRKEMPDLDEVQKESGKSGLAVIALSDEDPETIRRYVDKNSFSFETGRFSKTNELINSINTRPVSILMVNGRVEDIVVGARGAGFFRDWTAEYLE